MAIAHVSDTARWIAHYRAEESERPDALFIDPYARRLAGADGGRITRELPGASSQGWAFVVRTVVLDELVRDAVEKRGVSLVLNLAAGLDTRPWRLCLPKHVQWVDADFPDVLAYKSRVIGAAPPTVNYQQAPVDLGDAKARRELFTQVAAAATSGALVITEGLLVYLNREQTDGLARDLHEQRRFRLWALDLASPLLLLGLRAVWGRQLEAGNAGMKFTPGESFLEERGWRIVEARPLLDDARRLGREMPLAWTWHLGSRFLLPPVRRAFEHLVRHVLLERA